MSVIIPYGARINTISNARCFGCGASVNLDAIPLYKVHTQPGTDYFLSEDELIPVCPQCKEIIQKFFSIGKERKLRKRNRKS